MTFLNELIDTCIIYGASRLLHDKGDKRAASTIDDAPKELASGIKEKKYDHFLQSDELNGKKLVYNVQSKK